MSERERSPELMLGTLALKAGYITRKQLDECLREQEAARARGQVMPLGQLFVRKRYIREKSLLFLLQNHEYVDRRSDDKLFGQIAVANGLLSQKDLDLCLDAQRNTYFDRRQVKRIGQILQEKGLLTPQEVEAIHTAQQRMRTGVTPWSAHDAVPKIEWEEVQPEGAKSDETVEITEISPEDEVPPRPPPKTRSIKPSSTRLRRGGGGTTRRQ